MRERAGSVLGGLLALIAVLIRIAWLVSPAGLVVGVLIYLRAVPPPFSKDFWLAAAAVSAGWLLILGTIAYLRLLNRDHDSEMRAIPDIRAGVETLLAALVLPISTVRRIGHTFGPPEPSAPAENGWSPPIPSSVSSLDTKWPYDTMPKPAQRLTPAHDQSYGPIEPILKRYPDLLYPSNAILDTQFSLFVSLRVRPSESTAKSIEVIDTLMSRRSPEIEIVLRAQHFNVVDGSVRTISIDHNADSIERFLLTPCSLGKHSLQVDFYQHERRLGSISGEVLVTRTPSEGRVPEVTRWDILELTSAPPVHPYDLELYIGVDRQDTRTLSFELHSGGKWCDYHHIRAGQITLQASSPQLQMESVYAELSTLARTKANITDDPGQAAFAERRIARLGNEIWDRLVSEDVKREYWRFRNHTTSLLITSEDPWIPWEIVKPYRYGETGERIDEPFWCQRFGMARWLSGPGTSPMLPVGIARAVSASQSHLAAVPEEVGLVSHLSEFDSRFSTLPPLTDRLAVLNWLETEDFAMLHFAGHGMFDVAVPDNSAIRLSDGVLRTSDIRAQFGGPRPRPMVFINACYGAQIGYSFTGLGGWAEYFVRQARVGAFVGALWEVDDKLALEFARSFYRALLRDKQTAAEAVRRARAEIHRMAPHNSSWLAYVLYADPESRVQTEDEPVKIRSRSLAYAQPTNQATYRIEAATLSKRGQRRDANEDSLLTRLGSDESADVDNTQSPSCRTLGELLAVADGVGGAAAAPLILNGTADQYYSREGVSENRKPLESLVNAIQIVNLEMALHHQKHPKEGRQYATCLFVVIQNAIASVAWVGDCQAFLIRSGHVVESSEPSFWREKGNSGPWVVGDIESHRKISTLQWNLRPQDRLLLCTDGLTRVLSPTAIAQTISEKDSLEGALAALWRQVDSRDRVDDTTFIIAQVEDLST